jgi:hypothetical protein
MKMNSAMTRIIASGLPALNDLPLDLRETLDAGWTVGPARALLLTRMYGPTSGSDWSAEDVSQEEWHVNDVYVESWGLPADKGVFQAIMAARAFSFAVPAMLLARGMDDADTLMCLVSVSDDEDYLMGGTAVRFYTRRGASDRDPETCRLDAVAVFDMRDAESWPDALGIAFSDPRVP